MQNFHTKKLINKSYRKCKPPHVSLILKHKEKHNRESYKKCERKCKKLTEKSYEKSTQKSLENTY